MKHLIELELSLFEFSAPSRVKVYQSNLGYALYFGNAEIVFAIIDRVDGGWKQLSGRELPEYTVESIGLEIDSFIEPNSANSPPNSVNR